MEQPFLNHLPKGMGLPLSPRLCYFRETDAVKTEGQLLFHSHSIAFAKYQIPHGTISYIIRSQTYIAQQMETSTLDCTRHISSQCNFCSNGLTGVQQSVQIQLQSRQGITKVMSGCHYTSEFRKSCNWHTSRTLQNVSWPWLPLAFSEGSKETPNCDSALYEEHNPIYSK